MAVTLGDQELTYRELNARANQLAHYLKKHGVNPDVLVGLCAERSLEMVVGLLGILKAGGAYLPLDPDYPKERLAFMLEDARVSVLLTEQRFWKQLPGQEAQVLLVGKLKADQVSRRTVCWLFLCEPGKNARGDRRAYEVNWVA